MASAKSSYRAEPLFGRPPIPEDHAKTKVASGAPKFAAILALVVFLGGGAQLAAVYSASSQLPDVRRDGKNAEFQEVSAFLHAICAVAETPRI